MNNLKSKTFILKKASKILGIDFNQDILKESFFTLNDALYILTNKKLNSLKKLAYPQAGADNYYDLDEANINSWLRIVNLMYSEAKQRNISVLSLLDKYSNKLNSETLENDRFKSWFMYYYTGENKKYSSEGEMNNLNKKALFGSGLSPGGNAYSHSSYNLPGSSFQYGSKNNVKFPELDEAEENSDFRSGDDSEQKLNNWKKNIHQACRRLDKLLRESDLDPTEYFELSKLLLDFSHKIRLVKNAETAEALGSTFFKKISKRLEKTSDEAIIKTAQQIAQPPAQVQEGNVPDQEAEVTDVTNEEEVSPVVPEQQLSESDQLKSKIPKSSEVEPVAREDIKPIPGPSDGEYNFLGEIDLDDAASKLDEVAGMLSDRRIIRLLAEFDIMLDKIGIAAMFPELAEAQSKLIDGYSYALTRVTKMMGQLANAKVLIERSEAATAGEEEQKEIEELPSAEEPLIEQPEEVN